MGTTENTTQNEQERGFAKGQHVVLRPVLEKDLPELAKLLAADPCDEKPQPWTLARMKKLYEDKEKDDSGLWSKVKRYFAVVRKTGGLVGFLKESDEWGAGFFWNRLQMAEALEDRDQLGRDAIAAYVAYKRKWHNPRRISFDVLQGEAGLPGWLAAAGFELDVTWTHQLQHAGRPAALCLYAWLSDEIRNNLADDGPVAGEED
jgi:hypothetical protein